MCLGLLKEFLKDRFEGFLDETLEKLIENIWNEFINKHCLENYLTLHGKCLEKVMSEIYCLDNVDLLEKLEEFLKYFFEKLLQVLLRFCF